MLIALAARVDAAPSDEEADEAAEARDTEEADDIDVASDAEPNDVDASDLDASNLDASNLDARPPDALSSDGDASQLAMIDAEQGPAGVTVTDDANVAASAAGAVETYESWMRHTRPSRWGRLDLSFAWRRHGSEPMHALPHRTDEVWLVATWRR